MDAVPSPRLHQATPESCTGYASLRLLVLDVMCVGFDSYRGIHHRGHGATPSRWVRPLWQEATPRRAAAHGPCAVCVSLFPRQWLCPRGRRSPPDGGALVSTTVGALRPSALCRGWRGPWLIHHLPSTGVGMPEQRIHPRCIPLPQHVSGGPTMVPSRDVTLHG